MKKKTNQYIKDIELQKNLMIISMDFIVQKHPELKAFFDQLKTTFEKYPIHNDRRILSGYKQAFKDISVMAKGLADADYRELDELLIQKFGIGLSNTNIETFLKKIKKRKKIISDEEFQLIQEVVNDLCQTKPKSKEIIVLNNLLSDYEMFKAHSNKNISSVLNKEKNGGGFI
jgi:hypothetical protein